MNFEEYKKQYLEEFARLCGGDITPEVVEEKFYDNDAVKEYFAQGYNAKQQAWEDWTDSI